MKTGTKKQMKIAICDPEAFYPLRSLVSGPFHDLDDLAAIERFVRTVVLHDEIVMELTPSPYNPEVDFEFTEEERKAGFRVVITAMGPPLNGFDFFADRNSGLTVPEIELSPSLVQLASKFANAEDGNIYFKAHIDHLKRVLGVVEQGGSALMCDDFGRQALGKASEYPDSLFEQLDSDWQRYAKSAQQDGLGLLVPPVLGIVLTRCARRDAIPTVIKDLRDEWAESRRKVWQLLDSLRKCQTLKE